MSGLSRAQQAISVLWAAFLTAGVLEIIVFTLVDPGDLRWFGDEPVGLEPRAVYTLAFLVFWVVSALGAALGLLLCSPSGRSRRAADGSAHS